MLNRKRGAVTLTAVSLAFMLMACGGEAVTETQTVSETVISEGITEETVVEEEQAEGQNDAEETAESQTEASVDLEDGVYYADFKTDSTMFHVNEAHEDRGILTVENGKAVIHIALTSTNILNLYEGMAEDAENDTDNWLLPTEEEVTYPDGLTDTVNAFDVPVPCLEQEFDLALIGKKGIWYDHKVYVTNVRPYEENAEETANVSSEQEQTLSETQVYVTLEGGSGKSTVESPAEVTVDENGQMFVTIVWSSPNYDYMLIGDTKYLPTNTEGNSTFVLPIESRDCSMPVTADTVAMSKPHEIEYTLTFASVQK